MEQKKQSDRDAKCPYLEYHTEQTIVCEGLVEGTRMRTIFQSRGAKARHYRCCCCATYWGCAVCEALDVIKYKGE